MLQMAIEVEVDDFLARHADRRDKGGNRLVVRNGSLPSREVLTGPDVPHAQHVPRLGALSRWDHRPEPDRSS